MKWPRLAPSASIALGMGIGQGVTFILTPLISRLYSPLEMGHLALFTSVAASAGAVATMRMEFFVSAYSRETALAAARAALVIGSVVSAAAGVAWVVLNPASSPVEGLFLTITVCSMALVAILLQVAARRREFLGVGFGRATLGLGQSAVQVGGGFAGFGVGSLVGGLTFGYLLNALVQFATLRRAHPAPEVAESSWKAATRLPWKQALGLTGAAVANVTTTYALTYFLVGGFGASVAGQYSVAQRIVVAPVGLLVAAVSPVVIADVSLRRRNSEQIYPVVLPWVRRSIWFAAPVGVAMLCVPDQVGMAILGSDYDLATPILRAMAPLVFTQMVFGPLGQTLAICGWAKAQLAWDVARLCCVVVTGAIVMAVSNSVLHLVWTNSIVFAVFYCVHLGLIRRLGRPQKGIGRK